MLVKQWSQLSPYFQPHEILSKDGFGPQQHLWGSQLAPDFDLATLPGLFVVDFDALTRLNILREKAAQPLIVNSKELGFALRGLRSPDEQRSVLMRYRKENTFSLHCAGKAFDVSPSRPDELNLDRLVLLATAAGFKGIGVYRSRGFVHVDTRSVSAKWFD